MMAELPSNVFLAEEFLEYFASWQYQLVPSFFACHGSSFNVYIYIYNYIYVCV